MRVTTTIRERLYSFGAVGSVIVAVSALIVLYKITLRPRLQKIKYDRAEQQAMVIWEKRKQRQEADVEEIN